ncbi:unnamed protein product [Aphanomyces euteiches]|uniref:Protein kinase domain-containing protein n=1 Tax=Aphanomyces euteiches TaxID=100861 RepID=A0A6G0WXW5_9STRA|nr:hypothetical protein Ae201684_010487 [Aphanomyces euteiches]KAH9090143.1 hypothetical protein Ae201684P_014894 [Aphanomyces euteiches]KAH9127455.1 hypothetical protein LEN26_009250 [Aphanomyces euteiches]KAH9127967.1 hypothetical protein AeMF1_001809 [Aphanomyces euteiches]KAH9135526.1 hypothetical protein AeRB84_019088 [Aphanomyces euteiches]
MPSIFDGFLKKSEPKSEPKPAPQKKHPELDPKTLSTRPDLAPHWLPQLEKERVTAHKGGMHPTTAKVSALDGRKVFLKCIDFYTTYTREKQAFVDGALRIQPLHHPHLVHVVGFSLVSYGTTFCVALEYMEKGSLATCLVDPRFDWTDKHLPWQMCLEMAMGIHYLHSRHVAYEGISPSKVLVNASHQCKWNVQHLMHREIDAVAEPGAPAITPSGEYDRFGTGELCYAAPESLDRHRSSYDPFAADVYSLAIVFGQVLSKLKPYADMYAELGFAGGDVYLAQSSKVAESRYTPFPASVVDTWPHAFQSLMRQCLSKDPAARPPIENVVHALVPLAERNTHLHA